jgi:hypothetical protein
MTVAELQRSDDYIYGRGEADNYEKAYLKAQQNLINKISVHVEAEFTLQTTDDNVQVQEKAERIVHTYSSTSLYGLPEIVNEGRDKTEVWLYLKRTEMEEIFADRRKKVESYYELGRNAEKRLQIGDALRNYYWALELLQTHPKHDKLTSPLPEESNLVLKQLLFDKINELMNAIVFTPSEKYVKDDCQTLIYKATYKEMKVANLNYRYYTTGGWSKYISVNEGLAYFKLPVDFADNAITLQLEYRYQQAANFDKEVLTVLSEVDSDYFKSSQRDLMLLEIAESSNEVKLDIITEDNHNSQNTLPVKETLIQVLNSLCEGDLDDIDNYFTETGKADYENLLTYGNAELLQFEMQPRMEEFADEKQIRGIPMRFSFPQSREEFVERVNFKFDNDNRIKGVTFSLSDQSIRSIMAEDESMWKPKEKYKLIEFMEYYKTAYCLQDIDFIDRVFAENALIIVGRVLKDDEFGMENINQSISKEKVEYIRMQKSEYIEHLKRVFAANEFVNIQFEENNIKHYSNDPDSALYAIQIKQNYHSENYGDKGYLFLMMDLEDVLQPRIYIRSWQKEKFSDGSIFGVNDFKIE